jgi:hypothetical protein
MRQQHKINIGLCILVAAVVLLAFLSRAIAGFAADMTRIGILALILGLSIYKLVLWFRYRNDPEKRERVVYSGQIYPEKVRRFLMDEKMDNDKK